MAKLGRIRHNIGRAWDESKIKRDRIGRFARKDIFDAFLSESPDMLTDEEALRKRRSKGWDGPPSTQPDVRYVAKLFRNGVKSDFMGVRDTAIPGLAARGIIEAKDVGIQVPRYVKAEPDIEDPRAIASYAPRIQAVLINTDTDVWDDPEERARKEFESGWLASDLPWGPIHHEVGHHAHNIKLRKESPYRDVLDVYYDPIPKTYGDMNEKVSEYGATNVGEFVAEVFSGLMSGKAYPPEVFELYDFFYGPAVRPLPYLENSVTPHIPWKEK